MNNVWGPWGGRAEEETSPTQSRQQNDGYVSSGNELTGPKSCKKLGHCEK